MKFDLKFFWLIFWTNALDAVVSPLGRIPDWSELDAFQFTMTRTEFARALNEVYCPREEWWQSWIVLDEGQVRVRKQGGTDDWYELNFKINSDLNDSSGPEIPIPSLAGRVIALDPGHIGGDWAEMEHRHFQRYGDAPVREGDLSLAVARRLVGNLTELGARPVLLRDRAEPVSKYRPEDFIDMAVQWSDQFMEKSNGASGREELIRDRSELLFYRVSEIQARADLLAEINPDLVICIHFNAAPWPDEEKRDLVDRNDHHALVNGCYMGGEMAYDDQRYELMFRLLNRWHESERPLAESIAMAFSQATELPAFSYKGPNALKVGNVPGVWARNLLANRIYRCPVVFLEPYVANSKGSYKRIQQYLTGKLGEECDIVREYSDTVTEGLRNYFRD